jgi:two-component system OmpR family response regulator
MQPRRSLRDFFTSSPRSETAAPIELPATQEPVARRKILIVDDDAVIRKALTIKLESRGYTVISAVDGADALRSLREERPDLVLLDINYPPDIAHGGGVPWDGFLLMRWLRGIEKVGAVPIIFMTGNDPEGYRERALACGAMGLFLKPLDLNALLAAIERILSEGGSPIEFGLYPNFQI